MENKHTFQARLLPYFPPSDILDIKTAYIFAKFSHRSQIRKELTDGKPTRYFEHVRRVALILMDTLKIMDKNMIVAALQHDLIEDCEDVTPELLEHQFGAEVVSIIKLLSKVPKEGYIERLESCHNWKVLTIKACDRLDNLRSLMVPGTTREFQERQIKETQEKYIPLFNKLIDIAPVQHLLEIKTLVDEIKKLVERYSTILEFTQGNK